MAEESRKENVPSHLRPNVVLEKISTREISIATMDNASVSDASVSKMVEHVTRHFEVFMQKAKDLSKDRVGSQWVIMGQENKVRQAVDYITFWKNGGHGNGTSSVKEEIQSSAEMRDDDVSFPPLADEGLGTKLQKMQLGSPEDMESSSEQYVTSRKEFKRLRSSSVSTNYVFKTLSFPASFLNALNAIVPSVGQTFNVDIVSSIDSNQPVEQSELRVQFSGTEENVSNAAEHIQNWYNGFIRA